MNDGFKKFKDGLPFLFISIGALLILISANNYLYKDDLVITNLDNNASTINKLVINEILTDNDGSNIDEFGNKFDWVELYNGTSEDINLKGYGLSDKDDGSVSWLFPDVDIKSKSYLLVYLSGKEMDGVYANFSLKKSGGETLTIVSPKKKVIDSVKTISIPSNNSMYRSGDDNTFKVTNEITPGFENSVSGYSLYLNVNRNIGFENKLEFTEILPVNEGNVVFKNNRLYSYIEVTNSFDHDVELSDYYLSDKIDSLYKWRFPEYKLASNSSYIVYMNDLDKENNCSFHLGRSYGKIYLSNKYGLVDSFEYEELTEGMAYVKKNNNWYLSGIVSPSELNTNEGLKKAQSVYDIMPTDLVINEVMSSNSGYLTQNGNQYYDWIELYNNSDRIILLSDYTITTNRDEISMFRLPDYSLKPGSYYILMASGSESLSNKNYKHTNFKLSSGEGLYLYKNENLIDSLYIFNIPKDYSYGRAEGYGHYYYSSPTPGKTNSKSGYLEIAFEPSFDVKGGIYNNVDSVVVSLSGVGDIYYTTDGSLPNNSSIKYTGPIVLKKTTVIKAVSYENGKRKSNIVTNSYIINENHTLPVMSLSLNQADYNYMIKDVYADRVADSYVELFEKDSSFSIPCGTKLFGGASRTMPKKSFSLKFDNNYSDSKLKYKVFDDKNIYEFGDLVLRSGSQDQGFSMMRDEFISKMIVKYGTIVAQDSKPVVLYINGQYWGLYYIREKINENYIATNYNVGGTTNIVDYLLKTEDGNNSDFINLKNFILSNDMSNDNNYKYVKEKLDVDALIDYYAVEFIINNEDLHNVRFFNNYNLDKGRIKPILYDSDYGLSYNYGSNYINFLIYHYNLNYPPDTTYLQGLLKNKNFRKRFVERISYYMNNVWTRDHVMNVFNTMYSLIQPEMSRNAARWNQSYNKWQVEVEKMKQRALARITEVPKYTKEYFNLSEAEFNEYFK